MKRQANGVKEVFSNHVSDKGLVARIYFLKLPKLNSGEKTNKQFNQKIGKKHDEIFPKRSTDSKLNTQDVQHH